MICEYVLGNIEEEKFKGRIVKYFEIEWHDTFKKIHKGKTEDGIEIGLRMNDEILTRGLHSGDVIYVDDNLVIAIKIPPCEVIEIKSHDKHNHMLCKVCYEIGNRHATLLWGEDYETLITPYNEPMLVMIEKIHEVQVQKKKMELDFHRSISSTVHSHTH